MQVEKYRVERPSEDEMSNLANEGNITHLREELGLDTGQEKGICPFRKISKQERLVFSWLFTRAKDLTNYDDFIPAEVLEAAVEFRNTFGGRLLCFKVWFTAEYDPDPVLVAECRSEEDGYTFPESVYLIARWGDALKPFEELEKMAVKLWRNTNKVLLQQKLQLVENSEYITHEPTYEEKSFLEDGRVV